MKYKLTYQTRKFTRWLITASLFLSLISVSGYGGWVQIFPAQPQQTEEVIWNRQTSSQLSYWYLNRDLDINIPLPQFNNAIQYFNKLIKVKRDHLEHQHLFLKTLRVIFICRKVSQKSDEADLAILMNG